VKFKLSFELKETKTEARNKESEIEERRKTVKSDGKIKEKVPSEKTY
jgi:hypothetical protein